MYADLNHDGYTVDTELDNVVIRDVFESIRGGRTLDVAAFSAANPNIKQLNAGHIIIKETATGIFRPMPLASATAYAALPTGHTYAGILVASIPLKRPFAAIAIRASVNPSAAPYPYTPVLSALQAALPLVTFLAD